METSFTSNNDFKSKFSTKYSDQIKEKNFYSLLLKVNTDLRKSVKKDIKEFFNLFIWCLEILNINSENESCENLFLNALDEYEKYYNKNDTELFVSVLQAGFELLPEVYDKTKIKHRILKFIETKSIPDTFLTSYGLFKLFALDSIKNKDIIDGIRYSLKSQDVDVIHKFVNEFTKHLLDNNNSEKLFFISRICLELILMKNLMLSLKFIEKYVDLSNNLQNNNPILNFAYLLTCLLCRDTSNFDYFWTLINIYRPAVSKDPAFPKYLNKISISYYGQEIIKEEQGMNIMNLLKAFAN